MKNTKQVMLLFLGLTMMLPAAAQDEGGLGGAVGATHVIVSDVPGYVSALKANQQIFELLNSNSAGFCQAVLGGVPGEALVFSYTDSMASNLAGVDAQYTNPTFQRLVAQLEPYRELTGASSASVLRRYTGNPLSSWAIRSIYITTDDSERYIAAIDNLEQAAHANGFSDFFIEVQQEVGSGTTSGQLLVISVAPSLERLGASMDAITVESWGVRAFNRVVEARSEIGLDKIYRCEQLYTAN